MDDLCIQHDACARRGASDTAAEQSSQGPVWLPTSALSQALRVQEQMFVWFACLSDLAPRVQDSPRSQALQKRRNRPYLPGLAHLVQVSLNPCTVREIEIHGRDEPNNSCYWPG